MSHVDATTPAGIGPGQQCLLYVAIGVGLASAYDVQAVLPSLAADFRLKVEEVGTFPALTQLGVWLGVFLLLPLGDLLEGRRLVGVLLGMNIVALLAMAAAPGVAWLSIACLAVGMTAVVPYLLPALASKLARPEQRAPILARMTTSVFAGIVLSRSLSGLLSDRYGWQAPFWVTAALCLVVGALLRAQLPALPVNAKVGYGALIVSLWRVARSEKVLREAALLQGLQFASFNLFWIVLPLFLATPPHALNAAAISLYGLAGLLGVAVVPLLASHVQRFGTTTIAFAGTLVVKSAWLCAALLQSNDWALAFAGILMNFGAAATHVANQSNIFSLCQGARSRLAALYAMGIFTGGFLASPAATWIWAHWGWRPLCAVGGVLALSTTLMLLARWLRGGHADRRPAAPLS